MPKGRKIKSDVLRLAADLLDRVDAWALSNGMNRSDAIQRFIELGLELEPPGSEAKTRRISRQDALAIEHRAAQQLELMIDPETPQEERDRRIHRLTDGPPEFVHLRIDLPARGRLIVREA
jgi:hypothetical protein